MISAGGGTAYILRIKAVRLQLSAPVAVEGHIHHVYNNYVTHVAMGAVLRMFSSTSYHNSPQWLSRVAV